MGTLIDALKKTWEEHAKANLKDLPAEELERCRLIYWAGFKAALKHVDAQATAAAGAARDLQASINRDRRRLDRATKALADALPEQWW